MKLHTISVDGFGALDDLVLSDLDPGLNVVYGANGSGKSTLMQFLRGVLCGFDEGRKVGLLPPASGGPGGGALGITWDGDVCRFVRRADSAATDRLRVMLVRNDRETTHPRFTPNQLRADLVTLLYTVGAADVHEIDDLVGQAARDGIQLIGRRENCESLKAAAQQVRDERSALLQENEAGQVPELLNKREQLQSELHRLTDQLRRSCRQWEAQPPRRTQDDALHWYHQVTWLRTEIEAAESDLCEAQDQAWRSQPARRPFPEKRRRFIPLLDHLKPQWSDHIDVQRVHRLRQLDRRIEHARLLLAEVAQARLQINLRTARIAGSDDTPAVPFLKQVRESLNSFEVGLLELQDDAEQLRNKHPADRCVCDQWQKSTHEAVTELTKCLHQLCERVSGYELTHTKAVFTGAQQTINQCEQDLLAHLETLRTQRRTILDASGKLPAWKGTPQAKAEQEFCSCLEHEPRLDGMLPKPIHSERPQQPQPTQQPAPVPVQRPSAEQRGLLQQRIERLQSELDTATLRWREARNRLGGLELPTEVLELEHRIDEARFELDAHEALLEQKQQRWRVLSVAGEVIRRVVERHDVRPTVMQWASQYLQRLTGGRYEEVCIASEDGALQVVASNGNVMPRSALSRGTLDQVALSLRLALTRAYASRGVQLPLVLDDVLVDTDHERLQAAVDLLQEFAREQRQQILYLTCQTHLADLFELRGAAVRSLPGSSRRSRLAAADSERTNWAIRGWVDREGQGEARPSEPVTVERPDPQPIATTNLSVEEDNDDVSAAAVESPSRRGTPSRNVRLLRPLQRRQPDGPYWLSMDAPVDLVPSVGSQLGRRLSGLGVLTVADLINLDTSELSLRLASLQITTDRVLDWQGEAQLLCCVPDLTGADAQLLALVGIRDSEALSQADCDELLEEVRQLSAVQRNRIGDTTGPRREVVLRWIHSARRSRSLRDARRFSRRRGQSGLRRPSSSGRRGDGRRTRATMVKGRTLQSGPSRQRTSRRRLSRPSAGRRLPRHDHRDEGAIITPFVAATPVTSNQTSPPQWRFYLSTQSPVVDAPSIGPTTARRLEKIGVIIVSDLLNRPAADIAQRLKNRRIKEETVLLWKQQARLMCRIPLLRGHDAQVLVACDITEPEQVSSMTPQSLFAVVGPFVATIEGQRLLRSSKTPDLAEVTEWINWARHSRTLRAA